MHQVKTKTTIYSGTACNLPQLMVRNRGASWAVAVQFCPYLDNYLIFADNASISSLIRQKSSER
jgi:hypothetical protein